ncbi:hypothetical protein H5410_010826 [Solanum commersonii]|uniref:Uncharacterized protein n=1 Tax=Solanum commersonii TaxID=4109 RepID=A0A9J6ALS9_SOLCO|nr:hypothetical protein H5410_010826 [Solanum commersonii]
MARKISNHDEGEQNEMIMNYLEEQGDSFANCKEEVDDIKNMKRREKREMIFLLKTRHTRRREPGRYSKAKVLNFNIFRGYNTSENVSQDFQNDYKNISLNIEDWVPPDGERQFSLAHKVIVSFTIGIILSFNKVLCYMMRHKKYLVYKMKNCIPWGMIKILLRTEPQVIQDGSRFPGSRQVISSRTYLLFSSD